MSRKVLVSTLVAAMLVMSLSACQSSKPGAGTQENQIPVGVILPLSGGNAHEGELCRNAMMFAASKINDAGGIKSLGGAKLNLIFADHTAKPEVGMTEMERLILSNKVKALLGPYNSAVGYTTAGIAEKYSIPYLLNNSVADDILKKGYKWVFRANQTSSSNAVDQINFLKDIRTKAKVPVKRIALVYENTEWGLSASEALKDIAGKEGFEIVLREAYPANTPDMTSLIVKLKNSKPDVVIPCSYLNDALLFMKTLKEMNVDVKVFAGGAGFTDPKFLEKAGDTANNMFILSAWDKDILARKPQWATQYNNEFKAKYGYDFAEPSANSYQNVFILADALERAKSSEPDAIRKALMETNITDGPALINPYKAIQFGTIRGMTNQNIYTQMLILQVLNGKERVVWPFEFIPPDVTMAWGKQKIARQ